MFRRLLKGLAVLAVAVPAIAQAAPVKLGSYNIDTNQVSVSGLSSGAFMAVQFAVANSAMVMGVGAEAGGPYYCSGEDGSVGATGRCMIGNPDPQASVDAAKSFAAKGEIDPVENLKRQKVWLLHGYNDGVVKQGVGDALDRFFTAFTNPNNQFYKSNLNAGHAHVTETYGKACDFTGGEFINDCDYDGPAHILQHIYGKLNPRQTGKLSGKLMEFDQTQFAGADAARIGMWRNANVYVPASCAKGESCRLHVVFHGCLQGADIMTGKSGVYPQKTGYNEWADTNNIVVLYPQVVATTLGPMNPKGCWDWWGYTDGRYAKKTGLQIEAVAKMIRHVSAKAQPVQPLAGAFAAPQNVTAADASHNAAALFWSPVPGAVGYNVYRATGEKVTESPVQGPSFGEAGLTPESTYGYKVRAVAADGSESPDSAEVSVTTAKAPISCDPYFRDNVTHIMENRATGTPMISKAVAIGSNQDLGPATLSVEVALRKIKDGYYSLGPCE